MAVEVIDLNCDMGESFGQWRLGADEALMPLISSANIACGYHAGDPLTMERTVRLALEAGVAVGAHPGYPDLEGFGRRSLRLSPEELRAALLYQVAALEGIVRAVGGKLHHVKLHGAMYNDAAHDPTLAAAAMDAVRALDADLVLYTLAGSRMVSVARDAGVRVVEEAFADRRYEPDGSLQSRAVEGSLIIDPEAAAAQVLELVCDGRVTAHDGTLFSLGAGTVCIHGDNPSAAEIARSVRRALVAANVTVRAPR